MTRSRSRPACLARWIAGLLLLGAGGSHAQPPDSDQALRDLAEAAGQRAPLMRIGLRDDHRVSISSRGPFRLLDPSSGEPVWRERFEDELHVVAEGGPKGDVPKIHRVQVGAFADRDAAEAELERLERQTGTPGVVRHDPDRNTWRVRLGRAEDRLSLGPLMERLRGEGLGDLWIAEEPAEELTGVRLRLVDASFDSFPAEPARLAVVPLSQQHIEVDGTPYRGIVELRLTPFGTVRPINWVNLEGYLLGVVPSELGPEVWPQLEALRAQAVAARTYAWRNRGQFAEQGFDICATPRCQVYDGASAEHPLSDRAVQSTRGEVLVWEGRPIVALYTATCGGHTEDGHEVFPENREPYLSGVPCRAENEAMKSLRKVIRGRRNAPLTDETGEDVSRDWSLLRAAGVIAGKTTGPDAAGQPIDGATLRDWTTRLGRLAGLAPPAGPTPQPGTLGEAAAALVADLGWGERSDVLLSDEDLPALLRDPKAEALPEAQRRALAYLVWIEALRPFPDGRLQVKRLPSRGRMARALARAGEVYRAFGLREGVVSGVGENSIRLVRGKGEVRLPLNERLYLFGLTGGKSAPAERLEVWPGDRVRFRTSDRGSIDFLELMPPVKGASDDRSAAVYSWEVRKTRRELEAAVNARVSVGALKDLQVVRRGVSGRIVELRVVGTSGSTVVRGFDVRRLLDLRESLTVIEIQRDGEGQITAVVFAGKGWGHGVGLCQVGAFGMALRGSTYRQILSHYYQGASLEQLAGAGPG